MDGQQIGKWIMTAAGVLFLAGGVVYLIGRTGLPLGRLPGDIRIERENFTCIFPLATSIIVSLLLTVGLNLLVRWLK